MPKHAILGPKPTGIAATDRNNLLEAIGDTPSGGHLTLPDLGDTHFVIDQPLVIDKHFDLSGESASSLLGEDPFGVMPAYPFVRGVVIRQVAEATDIIQLPGTGKTVNLRNLGLIFDEALEVTGHGINADPSAGEDAYGLYSSLWESLFVGGQDGDHYAFRIINYILNTFTQCHAYGGGGWYRANRGVAFAGNCVWINPYVGLTTAGSAGAYDTSCTAPGPVGGINGDLHIQPVVLCSGPAATAGTQALWDEMLGAGIPFRCGTIGAQLQSGGTNPIHKSTGTEFSIPGQCNVQPSNTILGVDSLGDIGNQANQTAYGYQALMSAVTPSQQNTALGTQTLKSLTTGLYNTAVGYLALAAIVTTDGLTAIGTRALSVATTATGSTAVGYEALKACTTGTQNTALGSQTLQACTTGGSNMAIGTQALYALTTASGNTAVGMQAGPAITTGGVNTIIGASAGGAIVAGAGNTFIGNAASSNGGDVNFATALGYAAQATNSALALGFNTSALAAGAVAIGVDSANGAATTSTADEIKMGTALHTMNVIGNAKIGGVGKSLSFFGGALAAKPTGVAVTAEGIHAALVSLSLIAA